MRRFALHPTAARSGLPRRLLGAGLLMLALIALLTWRAFADARADALPDAALALAALLTWGLAVADLRRLGGSLRIVAAQGDHAARPDVDHLTQILAAAPLALFAFDRDGRYTFCDGMGLAALALRAEDILGTAVSDHFAEHHPVTVGVRRALAGESSNARLTLDGRVLDNVFAPLRDERGMLTGAVAIATDVTGQTELERALAHQVHHDALTGLMNRAAFHERVMAAVGAGGGVLLVDIDGFKDVNVSFGQRAGDRVLIRLARRMSAVIGHDDLLARLGGDEFGVVTTATDAAELADALVDQIGRPVQVGGTSTRLRASVGVATAADGGDAERLVHDADLAVSAAKAAGGNCWRRYEPGMHRGLLARLHLQAELETAIRERQFTVVYQPTIRLADGRAVGIEALVRWQHPTRGLVPPGDFVPLAEETGLIEAIGRQVLREACDQARLWQRSHPALTELWVAVNISAQQLGRPGFAAEVEDAITASGLPAHTLVLEVTETAAIAHIDQVTDVLRRLRDGGVRVALDDFGTGYSSLSQLQRLPVDIVKIDRDFVTRVNDGDEGFVARAVVQLASTLGLETVAEGVEEPAQRDTLRTLGCDLAQGYLFARPLPPDDCERYLRANTTAGAPPTASRAP